MIKAFLICDSNGIPFYSKIFDSRIDYEPSIFSGLISAISTIGKTIFKEELATINFGIKSNATIIILYRDFYGIEKKIIFVFLAEGTIDHNKIRQFTSHILIETKVYLKNFDHKLNNGFEKKIEKIIDSTNFD